MKYFFAIRLAVVFAALLLFSGCSSIRTNVEFYGPILSDMKAGEYESASKKIIEAEQNGEYPEKDRVLLHLDKGIAFHFEGKYEESNAQFNEAEWAIEELFTRSVSKGAVSLLLNDNALDYRGEVYENLYINIFKALNFINLGDPEGAYVEVNRVNVKLRELERKYEEETQRLNSSEESEIKIDPKNIDYYNNALAHFISHLIFRGEGEEDNSRISLEKMREAWNSYPDVYDFKMPAAADSASNLKGSFLNIIAFAGTAPLKEPVGARITTFNDFVMVSDPTNYYVNAIPFPGIEYGWNFKFEFPRLAEEGTGVYDIEVYADSSYYGRLELIENLCSVAEKTFETRKSITYFKTVARAIAKGIGSSALGRSIKKETGDNPLGDLAVLAANILTDATERADLRCWRTMPGYCFTAEFELLPGVYNIEIRFVDREGRVLAKKEVKNYNVKVGLNLLEAFYLD